MPAELVEKTLRYKGLLRDAIDDVTKAATPGSYLDKAADDFLGMARAYYDDGSHFVDAGDHVNALVCFSYGHAWLDAGVRLGLFKVTKDALFAI